MLFQELTASSAVLLGLAIQFSENELLRCCPGFFFQAFLRRGAACIRFPVSVSRAYFRPSTIPNHLQCRRTSDVNCPCELTDIPAKTCNRNHQHSRPPPVHQPVANSAKGRRKYGSGCPLSTARCTIFNDHKKRRKNSALRAHVEHFGDGAELAPDQDLDFGVIRPAHGRGSAPDPSLNDSSDSSGLACSAGQARRPAQIRGYSFRRARSARSRRQRSAVTTALRSENAWSRSSFTTRKS